MAGFYNTIMARKFFEADVPRAIAALEHIADELSVLVQAITAVPTGDGFAPRTSTGGPVSVTVRGVRITVEIPVEQPSEPRDPEERCFSKTYNMECEGTGHNLCAECANRRHSVEQNGDDNG